MLSYLIAMLRSRSHIFTMNGIGPSNSYIRRFLKSDRAEVERLLCIIPRLYPSGNAWLEKRLDDVENNKAFCTLAFHAGRLAGALIDVPKGHHAHKICTFFVADDFRGAGFGSKLFCACYSNWIRRGIDKLHITVADERRCDIDWFLKINKFKNVAFDPERYGPGRGEHVYSLTLS